MIASVVRGADVWDRDGAPDLRDKMRRRWPWPHHIFGDGAYAARSCSSVSPRSEPGRWRSSSDPTRRKALEFCRAAGGGTHLRLLTRGLQGSEMLECVPGQSLRQIDGGVVLWPKEGTGADTQLSN
jgi:hypothetical protein